ncbi:metal-dependent hydrolase [Rhodopirellula sp. SWK7]|uniref:metal-dependent hydrolase n=1 Tax=Rhodopirellula sp. SWK7 TaxID=595460 RepID=UPI0002BE6747|nr:metal-dependent hydrolase [Rhodopirellula sp. SWK7]EMI47246.1 beta-lactamase domain protein [Rhodopirellula sp. SWK7]
MSIALTWLSHATWLIEVDSYRVILDPFLSDNPAAETTVDALEPISHVLVSHGHFDHIADAEAIARRNQCPIVSNFEIAQWFSGKGFGKDDLPEPIAMNTGGQIQLPFGNLKMVPALHSSSLPDGSYGGNPVGFVLSAGKQSVYFACDTAYFSDMRYYAHGVDVAILPIGDLYTMGFDDSIQAIRAIEPRVTLPAHYGTWPPIERNPNSWARKVREHTPTKPVVLGIGERYEV